MAAESAQRGYLLTEREEMLVPYRQARERVARLLEELDRSATGTSWLGPQAAELQPLVQGALDELTAGLRTAQTAGFATARASLVGGQGVRTAEVLRLAATVEERAEAERRRWNKRLQQRQEWINFGALLAWLAGLLLLGAAGLRLLRVRSALLRAREGEQREASRLAAAVEHFPDGVAVFDRTDRLALQNARFATVLGLASPPETGAALADVAAATALEVPALTATLPAEAPLVTEVRSADRVLEVWRSRMPDGGQIVAVTDITRRVEAETIARQAQKMELLGQMTGGIAHDFNNLLQVVSGNLELVFEHLSRRGGDALVLQRLQSASAGVARGAQLTRHLLAFARRQPLAPRTLDPARLLHGMEDMLRRALGEGVELELQLEPGAWPMRADPAQLESALLNLTVNARDAMVRPDGIASGRVTIEVANATLGEAAGDREVRAGDYVMLAVTDTGTGMTEEQLGRAVEPFYTTKPEGKGTGLGLPMVFGFAKQSGGHLELSSQVGHGTTARLYLPRTAEKPEPAVASEEHAPQGRGELILVVEDDASVRQVATSALIGLGYKVREAGSADEALALLEDGLRPAAIFTDVVMPGSVTARELELRARALVPRLGVLFTSGYTGDAVTRGNKLGGEVGLLGKPWLTEDLGRALHGVLEAGRRTDRARLVLLVEDEELIRTTVADALSDLGFEVVQAEDGAGALACLVPAPDLLIADLGLPDMDGLELIQRARDAVPGLPVVVASGRIEDTLEDVVFLPKPFDSRSLREAVGAALTMRKSLRPLSKDDILTAN